ncbi:MAG: hypothetical protein HY054_14600 [Proteobacteria bacterium]|nr:hypothetical protein [Pseudomonadota bacterium]
MRNALFALGLMLLLAACETTSGGGDHPSAVETRRGAWDLGDWRSATASATLGQFQSAVAARYGVGSSLNAAVADLRRNDFTCAENNDTTGRGTPPVEICRKTLTEETCTGTWQVHFFDVRGDTHIARVRALFDRRCGREGLLGGPS